MGGSGRQEFEFRLRSKYESLDAAMLAEERQIVDRLRQSEG